jgi:hypothetical protein
VNEDRRQRQTLVKVTQSVFFSLLIIVCWYFKSNCLTISIATIHPYSIIMMSSIAKRTTRRRVLVVVAFSLCLLLLLIMPWNDAHQQYPSLFVHAMTYDEDDEKDSDDHQDDCALDEDGETCLPPTVTHPNFVATESMDTADAHLYKKRRPSPSLLSNKKDEL